MVALQLGRRNLTSEQKSYLRGTRYTLEKRQEGAPEDNQNAAKQRTQKGDVSLRTCECLADEYQVAPKTIQRDGEFALALDILEANAKADIRHMILTRQRRSRGLPVDVRPGTKRDAILYACGTNLHGKSRTNEDKRRIVARLLADPEWQQWSNREISRHCGVSEHLVRSLRPSRSDKKQNRTYKHLWGNTTTMDIGQKDHGGPAHAGA